MIKRFDVQSLLLLIIFGLFSLANAFSGAFLHVFVWKATSDYSLIGWFITNQLIASGITFYIAGKWVKEGNKMNCLRLGIGLAGGFYATVLWLGQGVIYYMWLLGFVLGIAFGTFWLAFNVVYFEVTDPDNRDFFNGWVGLISAICGMAAPWTSGFIISKLGGTVGYQVMFTISFCIFIGAIILSFWLRRRPPGGQYCWMLPFTKWRLSGNPWRLALPALASQGMRDGVYGFFISLIVYIATKNELKLGNYTLITSAIALASNYVVGRMLRPTWRVSGMFMGTIAMALAVIPLFFSVGYSSLLLFGIITALFLPLFVIPMTTTIFDMIGIDERSAQQRVELTVLRELGLLIGRIAGVAFYLIVVQWNTTNAGIIIFLVAIGAVPILSAVCIKHLVRGQINRQR